MLARTPRYARLGALLLASTLVAGCSDDDNNLDPDDPYYVPYYAISGAVVDWYTGYDIEGAATVQVDGVLPQPPVEVEGAYFVVEKIPPSSVVHVLSSSPPYYRATYNEAIEVVDADVKDAKVQAVSEDRLTILAEGFNVTPAPGTGILIAKVVDQYYAPLAGVPATAFYVNDAAPPRGPYFLDDNRQATRQITATSATGYAVFYDLPPGPVSITPAPDSTYGLSMPVSRIAANAVTLAEIRAYPNEVQIPPPVDVSFSRDVIPVFERRNCTYCHSGGGVGRQDGGLSLQGGANLMHYEITEEISPKHGVTRVDLAYPNQSLILTMPGPEINNHPNITFASVDDPDYQTILGWIIEGARNN